MKKLILPTFALLLSACSNTSDNVSSQIETMQKEIEQLKHIQTLVAQRAGLGELVRPDKISIKKGHHLGNKNSEVVLLEYTDLHCPFCKKFNKDIWPVLKSEFVDTGKMLFVGREYPLAKIHPRAAFAAVTLRCAAKQNNYSVVKDYLFETGQALSSTKIQNMITEFGLNKADFDTCLKDVSIHKEISDSVLDAKKLGLASTPTFILGKREGDMITDYQIIKGASTVEQFRKEINKLLNH